MERHLVWIWLTILGVTWGIGLISMNHGLAMISHSQWFGAALFFALIFTIPLFTSSLIMTTIVLTSAGLVTAVLFQGGQGVGSNPYSLIIFTYLMGEVIFRLKRWYAVIAGTTLAVSLLISSPISVTFSVIYIVFYAIVGVLAYFYIQRWRAFDARYEALLHEYRQLKRKSANDEQLARQEERAQIGREIHDRVGHKLTNLLMQLEVARMEAGTEAVERLDMLKGLAKESLDETRSAVKVMKQDEVGGLPAIMRLIRKLEAENLIKVYFSVKNRAFTAELDVDQTVTVYRAVQEALTNVMRHSPEREASVIFESPGESVFRFEISNPIDADYQYREGYGLQSMRERVEKVGGQLEVSGYQKRFIVRGTLPILKTRSAVNDTDFTG
ncbi:sensor histidine kinase [Alkalibacillus aidingensis]|uniref:sensor histidine kinase n=1 Tax=Alkalibacillus aidingensis TaxID=2747607 RepID=UPI00166166CF|nr:sensor histidine kinase [Alkalibacillus aidingensis]